MGPELKVLLLILHFAVVLLHLTYGQIVCASNPCQNGGTCNALTSSYTCSCVAGFTGLNCETNINECSSTPCMNGGTCNDGVNQYTCNCKYGSTGVTCATVTSLCLVLAPCQNGGTCSGGAVSYKCTCPVGIYGNNCEIVSPLPSECSALGRPRLLTDGSGTISSPFYNGITIYPNNLDCEWRITSGIPNGLVSLQFISTSIDSLGDHLNLYDGVDATGFLISSYYKPRTTEPYITTLSSSMFIMFVTDSTNSATSTGFIANYTSLPPLPSGCINLYETTVANPPLSLTGATGTTTSVYYPNNYTNWMQCDWQITSIWPTGIVRLNFADFVMGNSGDGVYLYDGNSSYPPAMSRVIAYLTYPLTSTSFASTQRYMDVRMMTDTSIRARGFSATYTSIPPECVAATFPLNLSASQNGVITSPNYPSNYFTSGDCQWLITATINKKVRLAITSFNTDIKDVLYVYNGNGITSTQLSALSGAPRTPTTITTTQRYMFLRFISDVSSVSSGFKTTYTQVN